MRYATSMVMLPSKCPKCAHTYFEIVPLQNISNASSVRYDVDVVRCSTCQSVVGALPSGQLLWVQDYIEKTIKKLLKKCPA